MADNDPALFLDLADARHVLLAVSGGSDSIALMRLAAPLHADKASFIAATVDHDLRPDSAAEAVRAGEWCRAAGIEHAILRWEGEKPTTGLQEAARAVRYRLLIGEAERRGCNAIMTAHTADDQAETLFMRLARGSARGLAGIAPDALMAAGAGRPMRVLRPLLDCGREGLRSYLRSIGQAWIDDPSNDDWRFERARTRGLLAALEEQGILTRDALCRTAASLRVAAERADAQNAAGFRRAGGCMHRLGWISSRANALTPGLVGRAIHAVGGGQFEPSEGDAEAALMAARSAGAATLHGAILRIDGDQAAFCREPAALSGRAGVPKKAPLSAPPGGRILWDNRFIIENLGPEPAVIDFFGNADPGDLKAASALHHAPAEAVAAAPAILMPSLDGRPLRLADGSLPVRVTCLIDERFDGSVIRFR